MQIMAARDFKCPEEQIELSEPSRDQERLLRVVGAPTHFYARGCGKRLAYARMCKSYDQGDCDWYSVKKLRHDQLLSRVSFDLGCQPNQLTITAIDTGTVGVSGCEHRATYVWNCPHSPELFSSSCNWIMNNESRSSLAPKVPSSVLAPPAEMPPPTRPQPAPPPLGGK